MPRMSVLCVVVTLAVAPPAAAAPITSLFDVSFSASQSLWQGGPTAGFSRSGRTPGAVGLYYSVQANSGTVTATQNGDLSVSYLSETSLGSPTVIDLQFIGGSSNVGSAFGASAKTGVFLDVCLQDSIFGCIIGVDTDIPVIDEGLSLNPSSTHTAVIDTARSANDADEAVGVGALNVGPFSLGPQMSLDLDQTITFTPTGLLGSACYVNLDTLVQGCSAFSLPTTNVGALSLDLGLGTWEIAFIDIALTNAFRNDIDLELRPNFSYIVGQWPPPGSGPFGFSMVDETFALNFSKVGTAGKIRVSVVDGSTPPPGPDPTVPEPGTLALTMAGLLAAGFRARRRSRA